MRELLKQSMERLSRGERVIWCVILSAEGSTPRGPGAKMAVFEDGKTVGTVGGGAVELQAARFAGTVSDGQAALRDYDLVSGGTQATGMVCGGHVRIGFFPLEPGDGELLETMRLAWEGQLAPETDFWLDLVFREDGFSLNVLRRPDLHSEGERLPAVPTLFEKDGTLRYVEPLNRDYRVWIFGGGHVSAALVPVLLPLGFPVTVYDSRPELAVRSRFPGAEVLLGDFNSLSQSLTIKPQDYVVVMTPGHEMDFEVLRQVLRTLATYIGCIGSRRKTAYVNQKLREEGFSEADLARIHAPIGLPILARTPEEIAISIAAELILHRAGPREGNP